MTDLTFVTNVTAYQFTITSLMEEHSWSTAQYSHSPLFLLLTIVPRPSCPNFPQNHVMYSNVRL